MADDKLSKAMEDQINDLISAGISGTFKRLNLGEQIKQALTDGLAGMTAAQPKAQVEAVETTEEKLSLKSLQTQLLAEQKGRKDLETALTNERKAGREAKLKGEVKAQFTKALGADSLHLEPYVNHYMNRFGMNEDGSVYMNTRDEAGFEVKAPLEVGFKQLAETDLKHVIPAQAGKLPPGPSSFFSGKKEGAQNTAPKANPILAEIFNSISNK